MPVTVMKRLEPAARSRAAGARLKGATLPECTGQGKPRRPALAAPDGSRAHLVHDRRSYPSRGGLG